MWQISFFCIETFYFPCQFFKFSPVFVAHREESINFTNKKKIISVSFVKNASWNVPSTLTAWAFWPKVRISLRDDQKLSHPKEKKNAFDQNCVSLCHTFSAFISHTAFFAAVQSGYCDCESHRHFVVPFTLVITLWRQSLSLLVTVTFRKLRKMHE